MKNKNVFLTLLSLAALGIGCDKDKNAGRQIETVKAGSKSAYDSLAKSFADTRQWAGDKIAP
ncbi:MAG TPA: hypothetical protein VK742_01805 [Candidatus Sulfotelmatobacter sp.]|jgi:hypothetical protein|nr:hypothetical protein [Candidatus Sulfotelmatobacter sp.]